MNVLGYFGLLVLLVSQLIYLGFNKASIRSLGAGMINAGWVIMILVALDDFVFVPDYLLVNSIFMRYWVFQGLIPLAMSILLLQPWQWFRLVDRGIASMPAYTSCLALVMIWQVLFNDGSTSYYDYFYRPLIYLAWAFFLARFSLLPFLLRSIAQLALMASSLGLGMIAVNEYMYHYQRALTLFFVVISAYVVIYLLLYLVQAKKRKTTLKSSAS